MTARYHTIDDTVAKEIARLRKKHPNLGHEGLHKVLRESGIDVGEAELKMFLEDKNWNRGPEGTHVQASRFVIGPTMLAAGVDGSAGDGDAGGD